MADLTWTELSKARVGGVERIRRQTYGSAATYGSTPKKTYALHNSYMKPHDAFVEANPTCSEVGPAGPQGAPGMPGEPGQQGIMGAPGQPGPDANYCKCPERSLGVNRYAEKPKTTVAPPAPPVGYDTPTEAIHVRLL
ncbi:hypothetical protein TELCIR_15072 [Teladorsagia circumcincta]|uniref:Collagen triple helix repeat protein n=1 Tax=Teladorsagia circumcincta TaxID=45464 RepID=A0A2G9TZI5_TELCI|nr:hypothetical protein TELCIR_15072 [Teladorsagia circumcincta]